MADQERIPRRPAAELIAQEILNPVQPGAAIQPEAAVQPQQPVARNLQPEIAIDPPPQPPNEV